MDERRESNEDLSQTIFPGKISEFLQIASGRNGLLNKETLFRNPMDIQDQCDWCWYSQINVADTQRVSNEFKSPDKWSG